MIGSLFIALGPGITTAVHVAFGPELPQGVAEAIAARLSPFAFPLELNFGRTTACLNYPGETMDRIGSEGFVVARNGSVVCAVGNSSISSAYATFRVAEMLGFSFLHPLAAVTPAALNATSVPDGTYEVHASPALAFRGFHIHTEHPLELVEVLQGADAVLANGSTVAWDAMVSDVASLFEWLVANRQNHVQWILLASPEWKRSGWVDSAQRQLRLRRLTDLGRSFGLTVGADIPIAEVQQRAWYMVTRFLPHDVTSMVAEIRARLEWLFDGAGFDYLATESGTSEFTHPECSAMLALINATANCAQAYHGKRAYIKVHASTGQRCPSVHDPRDGAPINFNFLPMLASKSMGVLPHTVQAYALDEPTDGAYGNDNFSDIRTFMAWEAANDTARRPVVFHPETNYWVNVDIDVPLFLPLQGERRLHDLRSLAFEEVARKAPLDRRVSGQLIFDSGWEWGSWLSDVIAARAAWDPLTTTLPQSTPPSDVFEAAVLPVAEALLGRVTPTARRLSVLLARLASEQRRLLTLGEAAGAAFPPPSPAELRTVSGWGLMSGRDAWSDILELAGVARTQPSRIGFHSHAHALYPRVRPLLHDMNRTFGSVAAEFAALCMISSAAEPADSGGGGYGADGGYRSHGGDSGDDRDSGDGGKGKEGSTPLPRRSRTRHSLMQELADGASMLAMRAEFSLLLYTATAPGLFRPARDAIFRTARSVLRRAAALVARREAQYVVDVSRIGGWRTNPTAYPFGYLWTVHSLYYWWRDLGQAERGSPSAALSPCYLNFEFPYDVVLGGGRKLSSWLREYVRSHVKVVGKALGECFAPPEHEYVFPRDLYAYGVYTSIVVPDGPSSY